MDQFLEMMRMNRASSYFDRAIRFAAPLKDHFGINHFWYYQITNTGAYSYMGTHEDWAEYCFGSSLIKCFPCLRHPNVLGKGISLMRSNESDESYKALQEIAWNKFKINFNLNLYECSADGVEAFGFATCFKDPKADERLLNELPLLKYFIKAFRKNHQKMFHVLRENQVDLRPHMGSDFYKRSTELSIPLERASFLSKLGCASILTLTSREKDLIKLLANGYPASYIASQLHLGIRTVENYIATLKDKLNCSSKVALIQKAHEIVSIGCFDTELGAKA